MSQSGRSRFPDVMKGEGIERIIRLARMQDAAESHHAHETERDPAACQHCSLAPALRKLHGIAAITQVMDAACDADRQGIPLRLMDENLMRGLLVACDELGDAVEYDLCAAHPGGYLRRPQ